ncbi:MAG: carboxypeptidase regulatory-like domain-containing protein [Pyrinomonadaceae bacterium]|nr:carboxypeptidase regulatory-like domain-containing protein [Pyrinomonadaceae bacterium]
MTRTTAWKLTQIARTLCLVLACALVAQAQTTTGNVRGTVTDQQGAVVPNAKVTITKKSNNDTKNVQTSDSGEFQFTNLLVGEDYTVSIEAPNFKTLTLNEVRVSLNQVTEVPSQLTIGIAGETVEVTAGGGAELIDTTTANLSKSFNSRQVVELAQTSLGGAGVNNLALIAPGVSSSGGVGVGTGGSVGGQRPRNNNFVLDGIDNNDKSVTGPQSYISPEEVAEFSLLQNQFSAEFQRSNGGQFITVTKSGTNDFHGSFYGFFRNRYLNALDTLQKNAGVVREDNDPLGGTRQPRSDYFRGGYNLGGPVFFPGFNEGGPTLYKLRDKLFFFTSYERLQTGSAAAAGGITTPTAAGLATINSIPGLSVGNLSVFNRFVPRAPINDAGFITVSGQQVPIGNVTFDAPNFFKQNHAVINFDYNQSEATQHRFRFTFTNLADIDNSANLPIFFAPVPSKQRLFSYTLLHNFSSNLINETRLAFRRSSNSFPVPDFNFPGLDVFPNVGLLDLAIDIGPSGNAPQSGIENNYQVVNNVTYLAGNHSFKFGGDFRNIISPQRFVQRERGDYQYLTTERFLRDISPDSLAERNVGGNTYYGNQRILFAFFQDDYRVRPNLTLNLGLGYSYQGVPLGAQFQAANSLASVPGLVEFNAPKAQTRNFAPKIGFAYSPDFNDGLLGSLFGSGGKSSIRAGFSLGYDYIFDNLYILSNPPQAQQTVDVDPELPVPIQNFLANGGIGPNPTGGLTDPAVARLVTGSFIPDQEVPYSITYTASFQRQFLQDYSFELRYLGTRGVHLLTQNRLNRQNKVGNGLSGLPTFFSRPTQAQIDATALDLGQINLRSNFVPRYANAGFTGGNLVGFLSNGNSTYHAGSGQLTRRFTNGFQTTAAYTWSHLIDDTTAEVFSTVLSPRRVEDFQNLRAERADSALDRRHRFVISSIYELPFFRTSSNNFLRVALGGFNFAGTYTIESGQKATVRSGNDANLNGDSAGDRAIRNPGGVRDTGSTVTPLLRTCTSFNPNNSCAQSNASRTIGYLANNPNAEYIQAGNGVIANSARNTLQLPRINNLDFSIFKNFRIGDAESPRRIQLRADFFNAFNHAQFTPGSVNSVDPISTTGVSQVNSIFAGNTDFNRPQNVFSSNPRVIQLALRFDF